jgi:hypothetical protein
MILIRRYHRRVPTHPRGLTKQRRLWVGWKRAMQKAYTPTEFCFRAAKKKIDAGHYAFDPPKPNGKVSAG